MREKYESLALVQLKELAKVRGLKGTSTMKKAEIVEAMLAEDERLKKLEEQEKAAKAREASPVQAAPQASGSTGRPAYKRQPGPGRPAAQRTQGAARAEAASHTESGGRSEGSGRAENPHTPAAAKSENVPKPESAPVKPENAVPGAEGTAAPRTFRSNEVYDEKTYPRELDSGEEASGILEVMPDGYGFIRCENYLPGENDVYVAPSQIRRFGLKTGDILRGNKRVKTQQEKFSALLFIRTINGYTTEESAKRTAFEDMTPIFPNERIRLEMPGCSVAMRVMDLVSPVGKGQRGMIVSPPKAGKTTLLKEVAKSVLRTNPQMHMLILLIDERPEEVTDIKEAIHGENVEVIYSTFDELPEHHKRVSEMVIERAKRLVEHQKDVVILLDSITRLTRAYNLVVPPSGRTLSGGLDPAALHMPKRFFGAARNMREGGSLTILATALVETGSKMDDVVYEEFKGTGNMEMVLDRKLSEKRIFPAIDLAKSGTRREDLLLNRDELDAINIMRKALNGLKADEATDRILDMFSRTRSNFEFVQMVKKNKFI
ncbi:MAG: transcription termination factor Rho [Butyrivibrio sp.]|nr:transcription termination factor Rho [Acetatifactor muris]MCM1560425.1 transcription termination factor Rho [Butyrivibrio sp.]